MPYVDLIPSVMPISLTSLANGATYRSEAFNVGDKMEIGIVIKASQALSVRVAYGASSDTAATAGTGTSASLPFITSATSFASSAGSAEAGTYHSIAIPPSARKAQLVITNSSGSTANSITIDAALRRQAYPSNASNVTSGLLPLAYGGTNADLSATGGTGHVLKQSSAGAAITVGALTASDIPSTLNATTFAGTVTIGNNYIEGGGASGYTVISNQSTARFAAWGSSSAYPGANRYSCGSVAGSKHQFFDKNAAEQLRVDDVGVSANNIVSVSGDVTIAPLIGGQSVRLAGRSGTGDGTYGAGIILRADNDATYPGAHQSAAPLDTRAASTAIGLCPVATGDMAYVLILESSIASCKVKVDTSGTVTFTDLDGNAASASIVNSSSPAAAEYGVYISAGVLYFKGGSSYAGKMASFPQIGKA